MINKLRRFWQQLTCSHIWIYGSMKTPGKFTRYKKACIYCTKTVFKEIN